MATVSTTDYITNTSNAPYQGNLIIHGPPGSGKTTLAASVSKFYPEKPNGEIALKDLLFVQFDLGGLDGLKSRNLSTQYIDARALCAEQGAVKGSLDALNLVDKVLAAPNSEVAYVIVDTVSAMDKLWHEALDRTEDDGRALYRAMLNNHVRFHSRINNICILRKAKPIFICHSKAKVLDTQATEGQKKTLIADKLPGGNDIQADITGQGHGVYTRSGSLVIAMQCRSVKGREDTYVAMPSGGGGFEGKNRFKHILKDEEAPNLRAMLAKLEKQPPIA